MPDAGSTYSMSSYSVIRGVVGLYTRSSVGVFDSVSSLVDWRRGHPVDQEPPVYTNEAANKIPLSIVVAET